MPEESEEKKEAREMFERLSSIFSEEGMELEALTASETATNPETMEKFMKFQEVFMESLALEKKARYLSERAVKKELEFYKCYDLAVNMNVEPLENEVCVVKLHELHGLEDELLDTDKAIDENYMKMMELI